MSAAKLRWGVIGNARIAARSVIPGIQQSGRGVVAAIASRDANKARATADQFFIPKAYGSYEEVLRDHEIDAVYIPLPNHLHKEWTIRAALAGKHVLCEKPVAMNEADAAEMADACAKAGVVLAEAFMYRHHPRYARIQEIIASGAIGAVRGIHGTFTFNNAKDTANFRNNQEMGGGALYDVGVYPISAARLILAAEPEAATVHAYFSGEHGGVDMMASGLLEFSGGVGVTFDCGMWAAFRNTLEVLGTEGCIEVPSAFVCKPGETCPFFVTVNGERREIEVPAVNQYALQADDFAAAVLDGKPPAFSSQDAVKNMRVLDACLESAHSRARVAVNHP